MDGQNRHRKGTNTKTKTKSISTTQSKLDNEVSSGFFFEEHATAEECSGDCSQDAAVHVIRMRCHGDVKDGCYTYHGTGLYHARTMAERHLPCVALMATFSAQQRLVVGGAP
jgi:hypothetical protein